MSDQSENAVYSVSTDGDAGPYICAEIENIEELSLLLHKHRIPYSIAWGSTDSYGNPKIATINLGLDADVKKIQDVLGSTTGPKGGDHDWGQGLREIATKAIVRSAVEMMPMGSIFSTSIFELFSNKSKVERKQSIEQAKVALLKELTDIGVDPVLFDSMLTNEMNRKMKQKFGITFLVFTMVFTLASYAIVIVDAIFNMKISSVAITALIIETPMQFIGILYIIARNLFPTTEPTERGATKPR